MNFKAGQCCFNSIETCVGAMYHGAAAWVVDLRMSIWSLSSVSVTFQCRPQLNLVELMHFSTHFASSRIYYKRKMSTRVNEIPVSFY